jgi:hypothetical protein
MTRAHFPFFSPSRIFLITSKIKALAHSTAPFSVIYRCKGVLHTYPVTEILEHATVKVLGVVNYDLLRNCIAAHKVLPQIFLYSCQGHVGDRLCLDPLGEMFHRYYGESVISLCWCEFADNIYAPPLQWPRWGYQLRGLGRRL